MKASDRPPLEGETIGAVTPRLRLARSDEAGRELVACGGWSRRGKLYTGSGEAAGDARLLDPRSEPARVRAMFTRADWTRRGLGTRILEACEAAAKAEGFRELALVATLPGLQL